MLLIYRAAGKCLRHSPSIVQPISLSCSSYFSTFVSLTATFYSLRPSIPLANVLHPSLPPLYRGSLTPFFVVPNILTDSDHKESPRGQREEERERFRVESIADGNICQCKKKTISYKDRSEREKTGRDQPIAIFINGELTGCARNAHRR